MSQASILNNAIHPPHSVVKTVEGNVGGLITSDALNNLHIIGSGGVVVTGNPLAYSLTITAAGTMQWLSEPTALLTPSPAYGYMLNNAGLTTVTLPAVCPTGSVIRFCGTTFGTFVIDCQVFQTIHFGNISSTLGGHMQSMNQFDSVELLCTAANTTFVVISSVGNFSLT